MDLSAWGIIRKLFIFFALYLLFVHGERAGVLVNAGYDHVESALQSVMRFFDTLSMGGR